MSMNRYVNLASEGVIWEQLGDQIVVANMESGIYCNIQSGTGVAIWNLLLAGKSFDEVKSQLCSYFKETPESLDADFEHFIQLLLSRDILVESQSPTSTEEPISINLDDYNLGSVYKKPVLLGYDDIDTLLQIDPIDDDVVELIKDA